MEQAAAGRDRAACRADGAARHGEDRRLTPSRAIADRAVRQIPTAAVTGVVLAGGAGRRLGGVDKGLVAWHGTTLAANAVERLAPQVGRMAISANRHLDRYAALPGLDPASIWSDAEPLGTGLGPLAGLATALQRAGTPWIVCVPCDAPHFPGDLVARLAAAAEREGSQAAIAATPHGQVWRPEPAFCLVHRSLAGDLTAFLASGERRAGAWARRVGAAWARCADAAAFANLNTPEDLAAAGATRPDRDGPRPAEVGGD